MRCPHRCCSFPTQLKALKRQRADLQARIKELEACAGLQHHRSDPDVRSCTLHCATCLMQDLYGTAGHNVRLKMVFAQSGMATQTRSAAMAHFKQQLLELKVCGMVLATWCWPRVHMWKQAGVDGPRRGSGAAAAAAMQRIACWHNASCMASPATAPLNCPAPRCLLCRCRSSWPSAPRCARPP